MDAEQLAAIWERAEKATAWDEKWRAIPGYDGYEVSDHGNVRSYFLKGNHTRKRDPIPRLLSRRIGRTGYPDVSLPNGDGSYSSRRIHQLVMLAFIGPAPDGEEIAHLNGDPGDARLANLAYVTHKENEAHKLAHGTNGAGERNSVAKLLGWQVAEIKFLASKSIPQGRIAALFGISHKHVSEILSGKIWSDQPARTDIPALLDEIDRLRAILGEARDIATVLNRRLEARAALERLTAEFAREGSP